MVGYRLVYTAYKKAIKREMRAYLAANPDTQLGIQMHFVLKNGRVNSPGFRWEHTNKEFHYNNQMYDVLKIRYTKDSVHITAFKDGKENDLNRQLAVIHQNKKKKEDGVVSFLKFFSVFTIPPDAELITHTENRLIFHESYLHALFSHCSDVITPPPQVS